ncbi:MAG: hypothetical protein M3O30_11775 [Planctomycetota bacterium]|nr:hypothetical protein [Planctomycetota bacterium]
MSDSPDYKLDISGMAPGAESASTKRPFLSVHFACCSVYARVYRNPSGNAYQGCCPRCGKSVRFEVGPGGTSSRSFIAY